MSSRGRLVLALVVPALALALCRPAAACPFCMEDKGPTLAGHFDEAQLVLIGRFTNPRLGPGGFDAGTTDFIIDHVLKPHEAIKGKKIVTMPYHVAASKNKFLVFCDVSKSGQLDPYKANELLNSDTDTIKYLVGAVAMKNKSSNERLRYFFDFLNSPDYVISLDAYREFAKADYKEYKEMAKKLDPDVIARWLEDPKTLRSRHGLFASLLGHCGKARHAKVLRKMIDEAERNKSSGVDGLLAGYVMLQPKEGWERLKDIMKNSKEFLFRYSALRAARFLYAERPDLVDHKNIAEGVMVLVANPDIGDIAIDTLRKWKRWEMTDRVLAVFDQVSRESGSTLHRAVVKFALRSPEAKARTFVEKQRRADSEWVNDIEELLDLEDGQPRKSKTESPEKSTAPRSESSMLFWGAGALALVALAVVPGRRLFLKGK